MKVRKGQRCGPRMATCSQLCLHKIFVQAYQEARQVAILAMEQETNGFPEEMRLYQQENPLPTFKQFLLSR